MSYGFIIFSHETTSVGVGTEKQRLSNDNSGTSGN
jgi:hypothetical protein